MNIFIGQSSGPLRCKSAKHLLDHESDLGPKLCRMIRGKVSLYFEGFERIGGFSILVHPEPTLAKEPQDGAFD